MWDILPGDDDGDPKQLVRVGKKVFFTAEREGEGSRAAGLATLTILVMKAAVSVPST